MKVMLIPDTEYADAHCDFAKYPTEVVFTFGRMDTVDVVPKSCETVVNMLGVLLPLVHSCRSREYWESPEPPELALATRL